MAIPTFDSFFNTWVNLVDKVAGWEGLSHLTQPFLSFKNALRLLKPGGSLPASKIPVSKPEPTTPEKEQKRRKTERKQLLAVQARHALAQLEQQGYTVVWTDGSAKWGTKTGWVAGYGATILGE